MVALLEVDAASVQLFSELKGKNQMGVGGASVLHAGGTLQSVRGGPCSEIGPCSVFHKMWDRTPAFALRSPLTSSIFAPATKSWTS
jgi:hypothetical protein